MATLNDVAQCVLDGDLDEIKVLAQALIDDGTDPIVIINDGLIAGMNIVAPLFKSGEMFVPEVMESADTMNEGMKLVKPVSSVGTAGIEALETIKKIKTDYPDVHFMCGLSNISYGLPNRAILNRLFVVETMTLGMDGYVLDPTNNKTMADIVTSRALLGMDNYCGGYIKAHRSGLLG